MITVGELRKRLDALRDETEVVLSVGDGTGPIIYEAPQSVALELTIIEHDCIVLHGMTKRVRAGGALSLVPDRSGAIHDPLEVADALDGLGDKANEAMGEILHDAADVVRGLRVRALLAGTDSPWSLLDILEKLAGAADHLLGEHACDGHGYEGVMAARDAARRIVEQVRAAS